MGLYGYNGSDNGGHEGVGTNLCSRDEIGRRAGALRFGIANDFGYFFDRPPREYEVRKRW